MFKAIFVGAIACLTVALSSAQPSAQPAAYPAKPIRVIVPFAPGGGTDSVARLFAQRLSDALGQPAVVENKPGADGIIGSELVARAAPDGYTLLVVTPSHAINPLLHSKLPYDTVKSFAPVSLLASSPFVAVVGNHVPASSVKELLDLARANPTQLSFGSSDPSSRLAGEMFKMMGGIQMQNIPYKGGAPIFTDVVGGHIPVGFASLSSALPFYKAGRLKIIGVSTKARSSLAPELPTISEAGLTGYDMSAWYGLVAPAGTPPDIVAKLQAVIAQATANPDVRAALLQQGITQVGSTPAEFAAFIDQELAKSEKTVRAAGMKAE